MTHSTQRSRSAYTLVEILVVLAIVVILVGLIGAAVFNTIGARQNAATVEGMLPIAKYLKLHWQHVIEDAKKETIPDAVKLWGQNAGTLTPGNDPSDERARVIWIKLRLCEAFPSNYDELINNLNPVKSAVDTYIVGTGRAKPFLNDMRKKAAAANVKVPGAPGQSAACLRLALTTKRSQIVFPDDSSKSFIDDTDKDGLDEFIDGNQQPLMFYRFGFIIDRLEAKNPKTLQKADPTRQIVNAFDPIDSKGVLMSPTWHGNPVPTKARGDFEKAFHTIRNPALTTPVNWQTAYYVVPTIVSSGADKAFGITPPLDPTKGLFVTTSSQELDNVYSFELQVD